MNHHYDLRRAFPAQMLARQKGSCGSFLLFFLVKVCATLAVSADTAQATYFTDPFTSALRKSIRRVASRSADVEFVQKIMTNLVKLLVILFVISAHASDEFIAYCLRVSSGCSE